jgi:hypothetical protein
VNCHGRGTLLGSDKYSDITLAQVSELNTAYHDDTLTYANVTVQFGYYFFGVKLQDYSTRYRMKVQ